MKTINAEKYNIYVGNESISELNIFLEEKKYASIFILVDENTKKHCLPKIRKGTLPLQNAKIISIKSGEKNKNIKSCIKIWEELSRHNAGRNSLLINLGGGVITDIGGFAASAYKRGIDFINIPTTLLAQVDASVGGKTGIDLGNFKNQVGLFSFPKTVFIFPDFLKTLTARDKRSGFAEMAKHALVTDKNYWKDLVRESRTGLEHEDIIFRSVEIKNKIVISDPYENAQRKLLNFGHTIGHAVESASLKTKKPLLHGEAIAIGIVCEAYLSRKCCGLTGEELDEITSFIFSIFNPEKIRFSTKQLISFMKQDKKNQNKEINFTLLSSIGTGQINNSCTDELIGESIQYFNMQCAKP